MDMPDRFSRSGARAVALGGAALFLVILGLLAFQMANGKDPALGAGRPTKTSHVAAAPVEPVQPVQPAYVEPGYGDDGGGYSDGGGSQDGYAVPQQDPQQPSVQPQQQSQAPLQSSTS